MTATVAECIDAIAAIEAEISGIHASYGHDDPPSSIKAAQLPCVLHRIAPVTYDYRAFAHGVVYEERRIESWVFITAMNSPSDIAIRANRAEPYTRRWIDAFKAQPTLGDTLGGDARFWIEGDGGLQPLEYAGLWYSGYVVTFVIQQTV